MNIFVLDHNPVRAAELHVDKHVVKMILETAQLLSSAHHRWNSPLAESLYKVTHKNHPSTKWVGDHPEHYAWAYQLYCALLDEYTYRYGKVHSTARLRDLLAVTPSIVGGGAAVPPPQCMPDDCRVPGNSWDATIAAYQQYYREYKRGFASWKKRDVPTFMQSVCAQTAI